MTITGTQLTWIIIFIFILLILVTFLLHNIIRHLLLFINQVNKRLMFLIVAKSEKDLDIKFDEMFEGMEQLMAYVDNNMSATELVGFKDETEEDDFFPEFHPHTFEMMEDNEE